MSERTCPECGETKPTKKFLNAKRRVVPVCTACRAVAQKKAYQEKLKAAKAARESEAAIQNKMVEVTYNLDMFLNEDPCAPTIRVLTRMVTNQRRILRAYNERYRSGDPSDRLDTAMRDRTKRIQFLEEALAIAARDARTSSCKDPNWYTLNTFLLNKHGYPCAIDSEHENICDYEWDIGTNV